MATLEQLIAEEEKLLQELTKVRQKISSKKLSRKKATPYEVAQAKGIRAIIQDSEKFYAFQENFKESFLPIKKSGQVDLKQLNYIKNFLKEKKFPISKLGKYVFHDGGLRVKITPKEKKKLEGSEVLIQGDYIVPTYGGGRYFPELNQPQEILEMPFYPIYEPTWKKISGEFKTLGIQAGKELKNLATAEERKEFKEHSPFYKRTEGKYKSWKRSIGHYAEQREVFLNNFAGKGIDYIKEQLEGKDYTVDDVSDVEKIKIYYKGTLQFEFNADDL